MIVNCIAGFSGLDCEFDNSCLLTGCKNGGVCRTTDKLNYACFCPFGFTGRNCEAKSNETCGCMNGGGCVRDGNGLTICQCPTGFSGPKCESSAQCSLSNCNNRGDCTLVNQMLQCICKGNIKEKRN